MAETDGKNTCVITPKYDWYQTDSQVVVTILVKKLKKENVSIDIAESSLCARLRVERPAQQQQEQSESCSEEVLGVTINLRHNINPHRSSWTLSPSKVEVKLQKVEGTRWEALERKAVVAAASLSDQTTSPAAAQTQPGAAAGKGKQADTATTASLPDKAAAASASAAAHSYPSSSRQKKDWDRIEADVKREEEKEEEGGDAALNQLFQKIYASGSDEQRRAMNKSFSESGGTVLSTNWSEVGDKPVDVKPPEGMEYKKWES